MESAIRNYRGKDVEMLLASATIVKNAIEHKALLQSKRATWADPFFEDMAAEIDTVIQNHLGFDSAKKLRESSQVVFGYVAEARQLLAEIKVQLQVDFRDNPIRQQEILANLGFATHGKNIYNNDQETIIALLYQLKANLTTERKAEIVAAGTSIETLENAVALADKLMQSDTAQESNKAIKKADHAGMIAAFNAIYDKVVNMAKIANMLTKEQPYIKEQFSFGKVLRTMNTKAPKAA